jgi:type IV fimbrial biogenesis protein FimT
MIAATALASSRWPRAGRWAGRSGFTLVEMIVVMAISAILLTVAVPSFQQTIANYRINVEVNNLVGDLQYARAEAIKQGTTVVVCPSVDAATCSADNAWNHGYIIGVNPPTAGGTAGLNPATVLRIATGFNGSDSAFATYVVTGTAVDALQFGHEGFAGTPSTTSWNGFSSLTHNVFIRIVPAPGSPGTGHCVAISNVGQIQVLAPGALDNSGDAC